MEASPAGKERLAMLVAEKERLERLLLRGSTKMEDGKDLASELRASYNVLLQVIGLPELVRRKLAEKEEHMKTATKLAGRI